MERQPHFEWDGEAGIAKCTLYYKDKEFVGFATCAPCDWDMMSEKTGLQIAQSRATINYLKYVRDNEVRPALSALLELNACMTHSTHFNKKSYEARMLWRKIQQKDLDLRVVREMLDIERTNLTEFIKIKDQFYENIRKNRKKVEEQ